MALDGIRKKLTDFSLEHVEHQPMQKVTRRPHIKN